MGMKKTVAGAALVGLLALAGCGRGGEKEGGLTTEENAQLNNAADMLDTTPDNLVPTDNTMLENGEGGAMDAVDADEASANANGTQPGNAQ
jgi:hypothetical protein